LRRFTIFKKKKNKEEVTEGKGTETETETATATATATVSDDTTSASKIDMKNTLVLVVVAVISVLCSFIFVTRFYSSKDVYDLTNVADASVAGQTDTSNVLEEEIDVNTEKKEVAEKAESESGSSNSKKSKGVLGKILVPIDSIVVNLGKVDSKRYLRVIISLEVGSSETEDIIKKNKVIFRDKLVSFFSTKNADDIGTSARQLGLRTEIKDLLNNELLGTDNAISQVYFSDFIIQ
jgi:flagellar basal body-associated protein FliL